MKSLAQCSAFGETALPGEGKSNMMLNRVAYSSVQIPCSLYMNSDTFSLPIAGWIFHQDFLHYKMASRHPPSVKEVQG
jgi:hypothetical protein